MGFDDVTVREATPADLPVVMNVLDGADLETDAQTVRGRIRVGTVLVALAHGTIVGAVVSNMTPDRVHVETIAVRRRWRGRGIGTELIEQAAAQRDTVTVEFDADDRPFYDALGFTIESIAEGRFRGTR